LKLDAALLKTIAGSDPITARDIFARAVTFVPQFTLWIASNYRPGLPADDGAVWERIREVPFTCQIAEADRKPEVRATLADPSQAGPAVLAWCVEGLRRFRESGIKVPDAVRTATRAYRDEMDVLADFGDERLVFGGGLQATPAAIRAAYDAWIRSTAGDRVSAVELGSWLRARGCVQQQESSGGRRRLWYGVGVVHEESER
jgi:putative DNA primase/helicase